MQIITQDVEDVFGLLDSLDHLVEIQKQSTLEEADGPESELKGKTRMLSKLTGLHLFKLACRCLSTLIQANIDKQQMDKELQGCSSACYEEIGKEKKKALSHQIYCLISTSHVQVLLLDSFRYSFWTLETMF